MFDGKMISDLRRTLALNAREFGERLGVSQNTVFRWEGGSRFPSRRHQAILNQMLLEAGQKTSEKSLAATA